MGVLPRILPYLRSIRDLQVRPELPQLRIELQPHAFAQVGRAGRATGARLGADLALDHQNVLGTPPGEELVVLDERLGEIPQRAVRRTVPADRKSTRLNSSHVE